MSPKLKETIDRIDRYVEFRIPPGGFLVAVLSNNLMESFNRADEGNQALMFEIVTYIHNNLPLICYGSSERVTQWLNHQT